MIENQKRERGAPQVQELKGQTETRDTFRLEERVKQRKSNKNSEGGTIETERRTTNRKKRGEEERETERERERDIRGTIRKERSHRLQ